MEEACKQSAHGSRAQMAASDQVPFLNQRCFFAGEIFDGQVRESVTGVRVRYIGLENTFPTTRSTYFFLHLSAPIREEFEAA